MSLELKNGEAAPEAEEESPRKRRLQLSDWGTVRRVLVFARPFRTHIIAALAVGVVAGFLTALNLMALIPVLDIIFDEKTEEKLAAVDRRIDELASRVEAQQNVFLRFEPWIEMKKDELRYSWTAWVLDQQERVIYIMAGLLVTAQIIKSLLQYVSRYVLQRSFFLAVLGMKKDLYRRCLALDLPQFQKLTSGDLISRLNNDMRAVRQVFTSMVGDILLAPITILFLIVAMFILNWQLTLIAMVGLPLVVFPITYFGRRLRKMGRRDEEEEAKVLDFTQETIQGLMIVKAFAGERREIRKFSEMTRHIAQRQIRRERVRLYGEPFVEITASFAMAIVVCVGAYLIMKSDAAGMSPTEFLVYLAIMSRFYPPVKRISNTFIKAQKGLASAERIFEIIDLQPAIVQKPGARDLAPFSSRIEFENVSFAYEKDGEPALKDFNLVIPKGRKVAFVGKTGAGKSTVARLIPRFYDVTEGRILIDGHDIRDVTFRSLRRQIAVVSQETILFADTVLNNIRYGRVDATLEEVEAASRAAHAHEFIERLPLGYDTHIGERGGQLSGGQRQRIAIARALLANTPILVFDEATSALDNESEALVQDAIDRLMRNRTVVVIAHRLSTVRKADEIVVLERGEIVERGTHGSLLEKSGRYAELLQREELAPA